MMEAQPYKRKINLMDETVFSRKNHYAQNENPKANISSNISPVAQSNEEIIDFVINEMKDTLGPVNES